MPNARWSDLSAAAATAVAAATALITGVGALTITGSLGRVQRNHGIWFAIAVVAVVVGVALVAVVTSARDAEGWVTLRRVGSVVGVLLAVGGTALGFVLAIATAGETERPSLDVKVDQEKLTVTGTATVSDMSSDDGLEVRVDALIDFDHNLDTADQLKIVNLSRTIVGPDGDGKATQHIDVQLPHGGYDAVGVTASVGDQERSCGLSRQAGADGGTACINLPLPRRVSRPALTAGWGRRSRGQRVVLLHVDGRDLNAGSWPPRPLIVRAVGLRRGRAVHLYRAVIDPIPRGITQTQTRIGVPLDIHVVCAGVTRARHAPLACPIHSSDSGTVELHVATVGS